MQIYKQKNRMTIFNTLKWRLAQFLELIWWKRYLGKKDLQEYLLWKKEYWNNFIEKSDLRSYINNATSILDVGCGPAGIYLTLNEHKVVAVDPLIKDYEINLKHFERSRYPNVTFLSKAFEDFETEKGFDLIFCLNAVNHFRDFSSSIKKLQGFLNKEGILVLSIDVHRFPFFKYLFRLIPGDALHPHQHSTSDYIRLMKPYLSVECIDHIVLNNGNIFNYEVLIYRKR